MKNGSAILSGFVKQIMTTLKTKTSSIKTRPIFFSLLRNKKLLVSSINHKLQALLGNDHDRDDGEMGINRPIVLHRYHNNGPTREPVTEPVYMEPDLTRLETEGSVIELVKKSKGGEFRLEDEIDQVADLFIKRFHRQILMQKQLSLERNRDIILLGRAAT